MKKLAVLCAVLMAILMFSSTISAAPQETWKTLEDFEGYGGYAQKLINKWTEMSGGHKMNAQLLKNGDNGYKMKVSWDYVAGNTSWGGFSYTVNQDWSQFEGIQMDVPDGEDGTNTVLFQVCCMQDDGTSEPFEFTLNAEANRGKTVYFLFESMSARNPSKNPVMDLSWVTSFTMSVVTSRGSGYSLDNILLIDEDGEYDPTTDTTTVPPTTTTAAPTTTTEAVVTTTHAVETTTTTEADAVTEPSGLPVGVIVGIVAGAVVVIGVVCCIFILKKKKRS